jgi:hypothetical protein
VSMPIVQMVALALILPAVAALTLVVWRVLSCGPSLIARHVANLALPFGLVPLVAALLIAGGGAGAGVAILILLLQAISGATESHMAGLVHWRRRQPGSDSDR